MRKRGISPLIASVLLIAFTIMLFVLISTWVRRSAIEPAMQGGEEKLGSALECMNTRIEIINICKSSNELKVDVDNIGDTHLIGLGVRVISDSGTKKVSGMIKIEEAGVSYAPYARISKTTSSSGDFSDANYGTDLTEWSVEIYPETKSGICRDAMDIKSGIAACPP